MTVQAVKDMADSSVCAPNSAKPRRRRILRCPHPSMGWYSGTFTEPRIKPALYSAGGRTSMISVPVPAAASSCPGDIIATLLRRIVSTMISHALGVVGRYPVKDKHSQALICSAPRTPHVKPRHPPVICSRCSTWFEGHRAKWPENGRPRHHRSRWLANPTGQARRAAQLHGDYFYNCLRASPWPWKNRKERKKSAMKISTRLTTTAEVVDSPTPLAPPVVV